MSKSLTIQTLFIFTAKVYDKLIAIVFFIILSRMLTKEDYGTYRQVLLVFSTITTAGVLGLPSSVNYFVPRLNRLAQKSFLMQTVGLLAIIGFVCSVGLFASAGILSRAFDNAQLATLLRYFSVCLFCFMPTSFYISFFISVDRAFSASVISVIMASIKLGLILFAAFYYRQLDYIIYAWVIFLAIQFFIVIVKYKLWCGTCADRKKEIPLLTQMKFALPMGMASVIGVIMRRTDQFMVSGFFSTGEYAVYANGSLDLPFYTVITASVMAVLTPYLVKAFKENRVSDFTHK
ncbi:MAG: oligosaccharide flippase family protein, partial [Candidatus Cloacimonetes bacterium]|nr:oligosaccharide flippase family protein [Candidatus Cloacimonadota bacterium]